MLLFGTWLALFRQIKLYKCLRFKICKCRKTRLSQDTLRKVEVFKVIEPAQCEQQKAKFPSIEIDLLNEGILPSPKRFLNVNSACVQRLGVSNQINNFDFEISNSLSHISLSRSPNMSHIDTHRIDLSQIQDSQKVEAGDSMNPKFSLKTHRRKFQSMR
jgi:hypothetical protein